jgi:hypothetical protein
VDWTRLLAGSSRGRRHAIAPEAEVTKAGVAALCGQWLTEFDDRAMLWHRRDPYACLLCREKQRQVLGTPTS